MLRTLAYRSAVALAVALLPGIANAQGSQTSSSIATAEASLKPGQFIWAPEISPDGPMLLVVGLDSQRANVYRNGIRIGVTTVSTGKPGHETPAGIFTILQKDADHRSTKYNNAKMPYMQRLTWDGVALHAGGLPGYPESHGCVHLPLAFAKLLFAATKTGMTVVTSRGGPLLGSAENPGFLAAYDPAANQSAPLAPGLGEGEDARWQPERTTTGAISIIVSHADQRVIVLRNGIEIGRAQITVDGDTPLGTHILIRTEAAASAPDAWRNVVAPGITDVAGSVPQADAMARVHFPGTFKAEVMAAVEPGATVYVTDAPILPSSQPMTVVTGDMGKTDAVAGVGR